VISRRSLLKNAAGAALSTALPLFPHVRAQDPAHILGHANFRYRIVPDWGLLSSDSPVNNCHGIVCDQEGHVILLTDHTANNVLIYHPNGRLAHKWGTTFPGAHGLSIVTEGTREVLYLTCLQTHRVVKATLDGQILQEWACPMQSAKYQRPEDYKPSWTLHLPDGSFLVLDGYGRDYILHYAADGSYRRTLGGPEGGITHWGPHGGMVDPRSADAPSLLIAMSDQQHLLHLALDGSHLRKISLPGGNPRQIRFHDQHFFVAHLADNWPKDRNSRGFLSVLDSKLRVVSNVGGTAPAYDDDGNLLPMRSLEPVFTHPHDLVAGNDGSLYVAQFASGRTYPLKLERI